MWWGEGKEEIFKISLAKAEFGVGKFFIEYFCQEEGNIVNRVAARKINVGKIKPAFCSVYVYSPLYHRVK